MRRRFVITVKKEDDSSRIKARWFLRGHHDPDLVEKVLAGKCHSPTLSQTSRSIILQLIVSFKWLLSLGDIKGAFLEPMSPSRLKRNQSLLNFLPEECPAYPVVALCRS